MKSLILQSFAKLNLYLAVVNKRKDKYHNIITLFERIDLSDKITIILRKDEKINIICQNKKVPLDSRNICYKIAVLLQQEFNIDKGVNIKIRKKIPVSAGLGGGSSNAASVLLGLNRLWKLNLPLNRLVTLGKKIGCDIPFFVYNTSFAIGRERGDKIKPLDNKSKFRLWHILIVPNIEVSTEKIYKKFDVYSRLTMLKIDDKLYHLAIGKKSFSWIKKSLFNSLEEVTLQLYPEIKLIRQRLAALGVQSILMSGSGPAVFGIISSRKEAQSVKRQLGKDHKSWKIFVTKTV